jgi:hypothetical protein
LEEEEPRRLKHFKLTELTTRFTRFSLAPPTGTRAFELRIFIGIFLYKPNTKSVEYFRKCTDSL